MDSSPCGYFTAAADLWQAASGTPAAAARFEGAATCESQRSQRPRRPASRLRRGDTGTPQRLSQHLITSPTTSAGAQRPTAFLRPQRRESRHGLRVGGPGKVAAGRCGHDRPGNAECRKRQLRRPTPPAMASASPFAVAMPARSPCTSRPVVRRGQFRLATFASQQPINRRGNSTVWLRTSANLNATPFVTAQPTQVRRGVVKLITCSAT
jgi:hypothetical protein